MTEPLYVVKVQSRIAISQYNGAVITKDGAWMWVTKDSNGWVEASSVHAHPKGPIPVTAKPFETREKAEAFARRWRGHPWWCIPNGTFKIIPVKVCTRPIFSHYERLDLER